MQRAKHARGLRFLPKLALISTVAVLCAAICYQASAQINVYTDPVGFITLTANGTNGITGNALSFWGLGMTQVPISRGLITAVNTNEISINDTTITAGQLASTSEGPVYFIEVTSGTVTGLTDDVIASDGAGNVYTANNDSAHVASGSTYKIYPAWTFGSLFGVHNTAGLLGGTTAGGADNVIVPVQSTQGYKSYFYYTGTKHGGPNWEDSGNNDVTNLRIPIDQGILIQRILGTNLTMQLVGGVKLGISSIPIGPTNTFVANVYASAATTLSTSGLYTGNPATGLVGGTTAGGADNVVIHNDAAGTYKSYFYYTGSKHGGPNWEDAGNNDATNVQIPMGANVIVELLSGHNGFNWSAPAPY